jgi:hypothetical protein
VEVEQVRVVVVAGSAVEEGKPVHGDQEAFLLVAFLVGPVVAVVVAAAAGEVVVAAAAVVEAIVAAAAAVAEEAGLAMAQQLH